MPHKKQAIGDTVYLHFGSNDTSGSGDDGANPVFDVRLCGAAAAAAPVLSGNPDLLTHVNYPEGCHEVAVVATVGNGFAADNEYAVFCALAVDGQNPTGIVGTFRLVASGAVLDSVPQIVSDGNAFLGASIAAILADVTGINGEAMRGTNDAALALTALTDATWTDAKAGFLDAAVSGRAPANEYDAELDVVLSSRAPANEYDAELDVVLSTRAPANEYDVQLDANVSTRAPANEYDVQLDANVSTRAPANEYDVQLDANMSTRATPAQVAAALTDIDLDHLLFLAHPTGDPVADSIMDLVMNKGAGQTFDRTSDALEALRDTAPMGSAMVGTNGAALAANYTAARAGYLDELNIGAESIANTGNAALFMATGFAVAGDEMDLVDAPNATAITAIQLGLALEATLTDMKGVGWVDESLKGIQDAVDGISPAAIADAVWDELLAGHVIPGSAAVFLAAAGAAGDPWLITLPGAYLAGTAGFIIGNYLFSGIATEATLDDIKGVGWTTETLVALMDAINAIGPGTGANLFTATLNDGAGDPVDGIVGVVRNVGGTLPRGVGTTAAGGTTGEADFQLDDGDYEIVFGPSANYSFTNPYPFTVSGATTETFVCALLVIPTPSAPDLCVCYADLRYVDGGQLIGAEEGYLQVIRVTDDAHVWPPLATQSALAVDDVRYQTNASGRAQFEAVRGAGVTVRVVRPWGYGAALHEEQVSFTVPDAASFWIPGAHT